MRFRLEPDPTDALTAGTWRATEVTADRMVIVAAAPRSQRTAPAARTRRRRQRSASVLAARSTPEQRRRVARDFLAATAAPADTRPPVQIASALPPDEFQRRERVPRMALHKQVLGRFPSRDIVQVRT